MSVASPVAPPTIDDRRSVTEGAPGTLSRMAERRYRMLGGLEVLDGTERVELGTRKQRAVLAVLLLEEARVVSVDRLVEAVWDDDPPNRAEASLQSYISTLRRALEPDRGPRAAPSILVTDSGGYALLAGRDQVDLWRFADLIDEGRAAQSAGDLVGAATKLRNGLAMSAALLPEFAQDAFARHAILRFDALQSAALELSYEVRLALGEHQILVADLEAAVHRYPLHEGLWALLAIARYRVGRQSEALRAIDECRRGLADTGVGLSPRLRALESDLLEQAPHLDPPPVTIPAVTTATPAPANGAVTELEPRDERRATAADLGPATTATVPGTFVGREAELAVLTRALDATARGAGPIVLVEGEPGSGKTHLLEVTAELAAERGHAVHWGRSAEADGSPPLWPWVQVVGSLLRTLGGDERDELLDSELGDLMAVRTETGSIPAPVLPPSGAPHLLFDRVTDLVARAARDRLVLVILDDVQWADSMSLELVDRLVARVPRGVLLVAARRDEIHQSEALARTLANVARSADHRRVRLGPLGTDEVAALVALETGLTPDAEAADRLRARTEGNPFYVRELARSMAAPGFGADALTGPTGPAGTTGAGPADDPSVPAGVRDVVRGRMQGLADATKDLLLLAALIGRDVDLGLLARAGAVDVEQCLADLEPAITLGVVVTPRDDPFSIRFSHDLVRESIIETAPPLRTPRLHLRIADALDSHSAGRDGRAERLAHHLWSAGPLADAGRTAVALLVAARRAVATYAYETGQQRVELALALAESSGDEQIELDALVLLTSIVGVRKGYVSAAADHLERAEHLARSLGHDRLATDLLYSRWASESQGIRLDRSSPMAEELRKAGEASDDIVIRTHGLHAYGVDCWDRGQIGESLSVLQYWEEVERELVDDDQTDPLRYEIHLLNPVFLGLMYGLHGDLDRSWERFDRVERTSIDGPYAENVWGAFLGLTAALANDIDRAFRASERCLASDPDMTFEFLGLYIRVVNGWARAMTDEAEAGIAQIREHLGVLDDTTARSGEHVMYTFLGEALQKAGRLNEAEEALCRASRTIAEAGQCYAEPRLLLAQARLLHAQGAAMDEVRATIDRARTMADERGAFLFVSQADELAATLDG